VSAYLLPILFALFLWWFSTGVILYLDGLPRRTFPWSMAGITALSMAALYGVVATAQDTSIGAAYLAFTCGLVIWGWHETSFLMGYVTGPRREPCAADCVGWARFRAALQTIVHHELAILFTAMVLLGLTWNSPNQLAMWTFVVLWAMRLSAKLNVFLGVPNLTEEFLPEHLHYLRSFLAKRPMNPLFPVSVTLGTALGALLAHAALAAPGSSFEATALVLLATLVALAILEHWFMVLPVPDAALWSWALRSHAASRTPASREARDLEAPAIITTKARCRAAVAVGPA
jgi:putative photosynthetic complex assembly protein 2